MLQVNEYARVRAALAPMHREARVSASQTSQVMAGHVVLLLEQQGDWWRAQSADSYTGWMHTGYLEHASGDEHIWSTSLGVIVHDTVGRVRALPVGARFSADADIVEGDSVEAAHMREQFPATYAALTHTAIALFDGARYEWGGGSNWGCDCSGLVQAVFALHGCVLPRDASQQAERGVSVSGVNLNEPVSWSALAEGDLLFFSDRDDRRITHVGIAMNDARMLHSALGRGGVAIEDLQSGDEYVARLRRNFVGVRRVGLVP